jgi:D-alanyl-D-alanine carboxypeptidase (penicillin-binding protein 5/6)
MIINIFYKKIYLVIFHLVLLWWITLLFNSIAHGFESNAKTVLVIDNLTNTILLEKNSSERIPPASMSKLMTLYMVFEALKDKRILMTDIIRVSKNASKKGGSKMFLNEGQDVSIEDIIRGIIIHSGNDACIAIAETLSGTENAFAEDMNAKAKRLGLTNSSFTNSTGWPDQNHYMSAIDLANLATRIRVEFPNYYQFFSEDSYSWNGIIQKNRNPLLRKGLGADGLKTGHTEEAGYGLVGSAKRGNRRITFVISGLSTSKERTVEAEKITNWAYRDFTAKKVAKKNQIIGRMPVWLGEKSDVALYAKDDLYILIPVTAEPDIKVFLSYDTPIEAPFELGSLTPARLKVIFKSDSQTINKEFDLHAFEGSKSGGFFTRLQATTTIIFNHLRRIIN